MHLLETYALSTGSKIGKPFIVKKFFPVKYEKYITIQNSSGMPAKCYDYFQQVVDFLLPVLNKENIGIVQIGGKEDAALHNIENLQGVTNINQTAHILNNSLLHVGNDSFAIHMANAFNVKTVGLYSITLPQIAGPYYKDCNNICLYPDDQKPSFNPHEIPKRINKIKPEQIINACLELLNINKNTPSIKTHFIGKRFNEIIIETVPNQIVSGEFFKDAVLNIRCDYVENIDINILYNNISIRSCCVVTDKVFDLSFAPRLKQNIQLVIYDVTKSLDIKFIENLQNLGIKYVCVFNKDKGNASDLLDRKTHLIDYCGIEEFGLIPDIFDKNILEIPDLKFKSNRILLSNGMAYSCAAAYFEGVNTDINNPLYTSLNKIKNKEKFLEDLDYCYLYS